MEIPLSTVISQYSNSPVLVQLVENWNDYIDPRADLDAFYNMIWNVDTAVGVGLDIWGRIVGVDRLIHITGGKYFGFDEATSISADPFNQSPFYTGTPLTNNYLMTDQGYRTMIYAKALANISDGSIPSINSVLRQLFPGRGTCYVTDGNDMTITYTFRFPLTGIENAIVSQSGILPKPVGVSASIVQL